MTVTDGFESGVAGWTPAGATIVQSGTKFHGGSHSMQMTVSGTQTQAGARKVTPVGGGVPYTISGWITTSTGTSTQMFMWIDWFDVDGVYISTDGTDSFTAGGSFVQASKTFTSPDNAASAHWGPEFFNGGSNITASLVGYFDDVELYGPEISVTTDENWPPRIQIVAGGLIDGEQVTILRQQLGTSVAVRGADAVTVDDTSLVRNDAEYAFGAPVSYQLLVDGSVAATSSTFTPTLPGGNVAITDAITGLAAEVQIFAWPDRQNTRQGTMFNIAGRAVFVGSPRGGSESGIKLGVMTASARDQLVALLEGATGSTVLLRVPDVTTYPGYDGYFVVTADDEQPWTGRGSDQRRFVTITATETAAWAANLLASASHLSDIEAAYSGATVHDIEIAFAGGQLLDLETRDWINDGAL